ncbi:MAG: homoserine kinase [Clostridiales bacterium]|jgi:homoserine kinase|nr:homoserine kinase [Clostridiales bacterium]
MITVTVPATSANVGPGFDCIGVALALYNTVSARETDGGLLIEILDESSEFLPRDTKNLVYRAMKSVFDEAGYTPSGLRITQRNAIPVTRGLGSSSASIVGGIMAANALCGAGMSRGDMISFAARLEGHPDNTTPALAGGMTVAALDGGNAYYQKIPIDGNRLKFAVFVPNFTLRTKKARSVLPSAVPHEDAVFNASRAALLTASVITGNYANLKIALDDRLHQQYRRHLIKGMDGITEQAARCGAWGCCVSGAGPAILSLIDAERAARFSTEMSAFLSREMPEWNLMVLEPDNLGATLTR